MFVYRLRNVYINRVPVRSVETHVFCMVRLFANLKTPSNTPFPLLPGFSITLLIGILSVFVPF